LKDREIPEIKAAKVTHHKFAHLLLACTILTFEITPQIKQAVLQGAKE